MFKKRKKEPSFTCNGEKVFMLQKCPLGVLMEVNEGDWNKLVNFLDSNSIKIYCTYSARDNFLNLTLGTGHIDDFINYVSRFCQTYPADIYCLNQDGQMTVVEFE